MILCRGSAGSGNMRGCDTGAMINDCDEDVTKVKGLS